MQYQLQLAHHFQNFRFATWFDFVFFLQIFLQSAVVK